MINFKPKASGMQILQLMIESFVQQFNTAILLGEESEKTAF